MGYALVGKRADAQKCMEESCVLFQKRRDHSGAGLARMFLAGFAKDDGDKEKAMELAKEAQEQFRAAGHQKNEVDAQKFIEELQPKKEQMVIAAPVTVPDAEQALVQTVAKVEPKIA